jgi:hypothetical protein
MIKALKWNVDYFLRKFKWYRKKQGGTWYFVFPKQFPYMSFWVKKKEWLTNEVIMKKELYPYKWSK